MSRIFDALQRSESECSGVDLSLLPTAIAVLKLAELRAISAHKDPMQSERPGETHTKEHGPAAAAGSQGLPRPSSPDDHLCAFAKFESLEISPPREDYLVCLTDSGGLAAEKFRFLGVRLRHLRRDRPLQKILITSTIPNEGKSVVAANLACTLARRRQQRTLLLEGDLRRPSLSQMLGLGKLQGICEWLHGDKSHATNIYHLERPGMWILPAGNPSDNPLEPLQSARLTALMDELTALFDWIIIDSPPVLPLADTSVWSRLADGILLVTRQGMTAKRQLQKGLDTLDNKKMIGALLNCAQSASHSDDYYYYRPSPVPSDGTEK